MNLGIKVGLKSNWKVDLAATQPDFCEIWFDSRRKDDYGELFAYLKLHKIPAGLHFWGSTPEGTLANLAYPDKQILAISRQLLQLTIDTAAHIQAIYVNFHPCGKVLSRVDFDKEEFTPYTNPIELSVALRILEESLTAAQKTAVSQGIMLTLESTPKLATGSPWTGKNGRLHPTTIGEFSVAEIESLLNKLKLFFANDFGHTCGNVISPNRQEVKETLFNIARRLIHITKLLHVSYIVPPYNGTDYHGCLYYDEFKSPAAIPNYSEIRQLLKLYTQKPEIYALVEPEKDHPGNFQVLKNLAKEIE